MFTLFSPSDLVFFVRKRFAHENVCVCVCVCVRVLVRVAQHAALDDAMDAYFKKKPAKGTGYLGLRLRLRVTVTVRVSQ